MAEGYLSKPIYLHHPNSFMHHEQEEKHHGMEIAQHLEPEQYMYEFPRKSYIMGLEYFEECSYTTTTSVYDDDDIVADNQLSPLQLPEARVDYRQLHWDQYHVVDDDSQFSSHSKIVYMKINKYHDSPPTFCTADEGFDDCPLIESASIFVPFMSEHEAACKIQAQWRRYMSRKKNRLEKRLEQEIEKRKTVTQNMSTLINQQQRVFQERLDHMRQSFLTQLKPLEARLRHESKARADMESMMSRVLDQLHAVKVQLKQQEEQRRVMQVQLDRANQEIKKLSTTRKNIHKK